MVWGDTLTSRHWAARAMTPAAVAARDRGRVCPATVWAMLVFVDFRAFARKSTKVCEKRHDCINCEFAKINAKVSGGTHPDERSRAATAGGM